MHPHAQIAVYTLTPQQQTKGGGLFSLTTTDRRRLVAEAVAFLRMTEEGR